TDAPVVMSASSYQLPATSYQRLPVKTCWKLAAGSWELLLRPIIRVDLDVLGDQVAGPDRGLFRTAGAEIDFDLDVFALQVRSSLRRVCVVRLATFEQHDAANAHGRATELERHAGAAGRGNQSSPIRIAAVHRGFY